MTDLSAPFAPDWASPPGDTILDILEERDWTQAELAKRSGYSVKHINNLVKGKVPLSEDVAVALELVLGTSAKFWLTREAEYRERLAKIEAAQNHARWVPWLERFPVRDLMQHGCIKRMRMTAAVKPDLVADCLRFFGVASPDEWEAHYGCMQAAFRRSRPEQSDIMAIASWLRMGEREAETLDLPKYDRKAFISGIKEMRKLTCLGPDDFGPVLRKLFDQAGVAFVLVPKIPKAHVSGVARWLNPHRPLIQLSLYGRTNDRFWFTLFHECAHILLHGDDKDSVYLDDPAGATIFTDKENEANLWAGTFLIPTAAARNLSTLTTKATISAFAKEIGIHPGIVVGRLQHEKLIEHWQFNDFKVSYVLRNAD